MRTKTLVLTAVLGLASSVAVMAQSVYSLNAVGYVNTVVPSGFSIIANPLKTSTNTLSSLLTGVVTDSTMVYKYANGDFEIATHIGGADGFWDNDLTLNPGEAAWINNPGKAFTNTFVGEVSTGALTVSIPAGFSLAASVVPQSGAVDTDLGFPATDGDTIYLYRNNDFQIANFINSVVGWDNDVTVNVGEGFWVLTGAQKNWVRNFTLN